MALILTWDNTDLLLNTNVIAQRALQRMKIIGGSFLTTGFSPANDLATSITSVNFTGTANRIYEFKIQAICTSGGPTDNTNGIKEGITFGCITPDIEVLGTTSVSISIDTTGTDIEGANIKIKKQSDNSIVGTDDVPVALSSIDKTFTGLVANTDYYFEVVFYTTIEGSQYNMEGFCGGNVTNYQVTTAI